MKFDIGDEIISSDGTLGRVVKFTLHPQDYRMTRIQTKGMGFVFIDEKQNYSNKHFFFDADDKFFTLDNWSLHLQPNDILKGML